MSVPDNVSRGPARWERAALNALHRPNSKAARLYQDRVSRARLLSDRARDDDIADGPVQFMHWRENKRLLVTCSTFCTVMQIQLEFAGDSFEGIADAFAGLGQAGHRRIQSLDVSTLKRAVRCQVCGTTVGPA